MHIAICRYTVPGAIPLQPCRLLVLDRLKDTNDTVNRLTFHHVIGGLADAGAARAYGDAGPGGPEHREIGRPPDLPAPTVSYHARWLHLKKVAGLPCATDGLSIRADRTLRGPYGPRKVC